MSDVDNPRAGLTDDATGLRRVDSAQAFCDARRVVSMLLHFRSFCRLEQLAELVRNSARFVALGNAKGLHLCGLLMGTCI